jgi:outer membrane protein assembly factor BamB
MNRASSFLAAAALTTAFVFPAIARAEEDWPTFRGPNQDGHSDAKNLPTEWSPEKNVVWKAALPGKAWSSPIVAEGVIYLTNAVAVTNVVDPHDARSLRVLALDAKTGAMIWDKEVFLVNDPAGLGMHHKNSCASPTPIFEAGRIYAHYGHLGTACLDTKGRIIWKTKELAYHPQHGNGGCPVIVDDLLIFNCDAAENPFIAALDKGSGKVRWQVPRETDAKKTFSFCTPLVIEVNAKPQLISPGSNMVLALNPEDGSEIWKVRYDGYSVIPQPVYSHGLVYISTSFDRPVAMAIKPGAGDITDTNVAWRIDKHAPHTPSMVVVGDDIYMVADNGLVTCAEAETGNVVWQERVAGPCSASPIYADDKLYIQDENGVGYVLKAGRNFEPLARNDLQDKTLATYAVTGNRLLIRTQHALYCIGNQGS